jgi:hypothetical protein
MVAALAGIVHDRQAASGHEQHQCDNQQGSLHIRPPLSATAPNVPVRPINAFIGVIIANGGAALYRRCNKMLEKSPGFWPRLNPRLSRAGAAHWGAKSNLTESALTLPLS